MRPTGGTGREKRDSRRDPTILRSFTDCGRKRRRTRWKLLLFRTLLRRRGRKRVLNSFSPGDENRENAPKKKARTKRPQPRGWLRSSVNARTRRQRSAFRRGRPKRQERKSLSKNRRGVRQGFEKTSRSAFSIGGSRDALGNPSPETQKGREKRQRKSYTEKGMVSRSGRDVRTRAARMVLALFEA